MKIIKIIKNHYSLIIFIFHRFHKSHLTNRLHPYPADGHSHRAIISIFHLYSHQISAQIVIDLEGCPVQDTFESSDNGMEEEKPHLE